MKLTNATVRSAKSNDVKTVKFPDGMGLHLEVPPAGKKRWRFRYRFAGKQKCISLGVYPDVSLKYARQLREQARGLLAKGIDPSQQRKSDKSQIEESNQNTFKSVAEAWFNTRKDRLTQKSQVNVSGILRRNLYPYVGDKPIRQITSNDLLEALRETESKGQHSTVKKALQFASRIFKFGVRRRLVEYDITPGLQEDLTTPKTTHRAAIIDPKKVGPLMLAIDTYKGSPQVCCALRLLPLTFVRPGELCRAEWFEIDWEDSLWRIDASKMKMREDHIIPLSRQALEILHNIHCDTGNYGYVFPNARDSKKPMSNGAMNKALRSLGYKGIMTGHSFRTTARTLLDERLRKRIDWIEQQTSHTVRDPLGRAYNRTEHLDERKEMMQEWADYLDDLKAYAAASKG